MFSQVFNNPMDAIERTKFENATIGTAGSNLFTSDIPEGRMLIPLGLILTETAGAANTLTVNKVEEDDSTTGLATVNLASSETRFVPLLDGGVLLPRFEGGTNIELTAGSASIEVTLVYVYNLE